MGQVHSSDRPGLVFSSRRDRYWVEQFAVYGSGAAPLLSGGADAGNQYVSSRRHDGRPLAYTQDPETGNLIVQVPYAAELRVHAALHAPDGEVVYGTSLEELRAALSNESPARVPFSSGQFALNVPSVERLGGFPLHIAYQGPNAIVGASLWISERPAIELNTRLLGELQSPTDATPPVALLPPAGASSGAQSQAQAPTQAPAPAAGTATPHARAYSRSHSRSHSRSPPLASSPASGQPSSAPTQQQAPQSHSQFPGQTLSAQPLQAAQDALLSPRVTRDAPPRAMRPTSENFAPADDGPQFRASLGQMERLVPALKARTKLLLKKALVARERLAALVAADDELAVAVDAASRAELPALRPLADWFSGRSDGGLSAVQRARKVAITELTTRIVEPLQQLYDCDVRAFDGRKREFDEYSSQFYSWTSRYLAKEGRRGESADTKFAAKKRAFDAARLDYFIYLNELCGGLKQQILLQLFALAVQSLTDAHIALGSELSARTRPQIDEVLRDVKSAAKDWERYRAECVEKRRALALLADTPSSPTPPRRVHKEGLLWACNRPYPDAPTQPLQNKWHKYWIVQDGCWLREYSNWKQSMDLHNEPINLLTASVRETTASDRRFCFEIITPQYRRVYQATSEDDQRAWIASITQGIASLFEQDQPATATADGHRPSPPLSSHSTPSSSYVTLPAPKPKATQPLEQLTRKISLKKERPRVPPLITALAPAQQPFSPAADDALLAKVQQIPSDRTCAECRTTRAVEWVSINLLLVLCIDCSGAHRSLGAHISKVRSLTLDVGAFTPSLRVALFAVSNARLNAVWEELMPPTEKPAPTATPKTRLKFITEKYVEKRFVRELPKPNAALRRAIAARDIPEVCAALASRANPNAVSDDGEPMLVLALRCEPADSAIFPAAEVLIKNGAAVPGADVTFGGLSAHALRYLEAKRKQP